MQCKTYQAEETETLVWKFVSDLLRDPDRLRSGLERMIEQERDKSRGDPEREAKVWLHKLAEVDRKRSGFQDMAAEGLLTFEELRAKLADLEDTRKIAERELKVLRERAERMEVLERDTGTLLASFSNVVPGTLDELTPEKRNQIYKMLKLRLIAGIDGSLRLEGVFCGDLDVPTSETTS